MTDHELARAILSGRGYHYTHADVRRLAAAVLSPRPAAVVPAATIARILDCQ